MKIFHFLGNNLALFLSCKNKPLKQYCFLSLFLRGILKGSLITIGISFTRYYFLYNFYEIHTYVDCMYLVCSHTAWLNQALDLIQWTNTFRPKIIRSTFLSKSSCFQKKGKRDKKGKKDTNKKEGWWLHENWDRAKW